MEAEIEVNLNNKFRDVTKNIDFSELCITSNSKIIFNDNYDVKIKTTKALGSKCPVCWKINIKPCTRHS